MSEVPAVQPQVKGGIQPGQSPRHAAFQAGSQRAIARLESLKFDPIGELVDSYHKTCDEITIQEALRDGTLQELKADGKPKAFYMDNLLRLMEMKINIADKLLRYGYGRVPETVVEEKQAPPSFVFQLTPKGVPYKLPDTTEDGQFVEND